MFVTDLADPIQPADDHVSELYREWLAECRPVVPYRRSFLAWAEHCHECAFPTCYETCELYSPRRIDRRCRRFQFGLRSLSDYGVKLDRQAVEIEFKPWGKLETPGNLLLHSARLVSFCERVYEGVRPLLRGMSRLIGPVVSYPGVINVATTHVITERIRALGKRAVTTLPSRFCLEVINLGELPSRIQLNMKWHGLPPFQYTTLLLPGYNRKDVLAPAFSPHIQPGESFRIYLSPEGDELARWAILTADFVDLPTSPGGEMIAEGAADDLCLSSAQPARHTEATGQTKCTSGDAEDIPGLNAARPHGGPGGKAIKCVVLDLDDTLWDGVLVEGDDLRLKAPVESVLLELDRRGILLSIASKNDPAVVAETLERFGIHHYFLHSQVSWEPKSRSVRRIQQELNIGADTILFIDDQVFERAEVKEALPEIRVTSPLALEHLLNDPVLQGDASGQSQHRRRMYKEEQVRREYRSNVGDTSYMSFLCNCEIELFIQHPEAHHLERLYQLIQRTNQLNFTGHRFDRVGVESLLATPEAEFFILSARDRFGDYGLVGFCAVEADESSGEARVAEMTFSCRIQSKTVDQSFISAVCRHYLARGFRSFRLRYRPTERNGHVVEVLRDCAFAPGADDWWCLTTPASLPPTDHLTIHWQARAPVPVTSTAVSAT